MSERQATPRPDTEADGDADGSRVASEQRAREMYRLRIEEQLTLGQIGQRFGIGAERTRQILKRHCHINKITYPSHVKHQSR